MLLENPLAVSVSAVVAWFSGRRTRFGGSRTTASYERCRPRRRLGFPTAISIERVSIPSTRFRSSHSDNFSEFKSLVAEQSRTAKIHPTRRRSRASRRGRPRRASFSARLPTLLRLRRAVGRFSRTRHAHHAIDRFCADLFGRGAIGPDTRADPLHPTANG